MKRMPFYLLEEIIQRNDAKYKLLSTPRGAISNFDSVSRDIHRIAVYGVTGDDGNILVDFEKETKTVARPSFLQGKRKAYALNLCSRRLGSLLPTRSILLVDPEEMVSVGDIAVYKITEEEFKVLSLREDDNGQLYGIRWNPDEKTKINNNELTNLQKVVAIYL